MTTLPPRTHEVSMGVAEAEGKIDTKAIANLIIDHNRTAAVDLIASLLNARSLGVLFAAQNSMLGAMNYSRAHLDLKRAEFEGQYNELLHTTACRSFAAAGVAKFNARCS
jgi:hypothetical protein